MENKKIVEYYPSKEGLKNIYGKLLKSGGTIVIPEVGDMTIEYDDSVRNKVVSSYIKDGGTKEMAEYIVDYFEYIYGKYKYQTLNTHLV